MSGPFAITAATSSVRLDANRRATTAFTVSNTSGIPVRGRARLVPQDPAAQGWLTLIGEAERNFSTTGTEQYTVQVVVPADAAPGRYIFRLDVVGVVNPDEMFSEGPTVTFEVGGSKPQKKPFPWWILLVLAGTLAIIACIVTFVLWPRGVEVPDVTGMTVQDATGVLVEAGFGVGEVTLVSSDGVPQGGVIRSDPAGNENAKEGTEVSLVISDGPASPDTVQVPNLSGLTPAEAEAELGQADLVLGGSINEFNDAIAAGQVIESNPAAGTEVAPGWAVVLIVSDGPVLVEVPNLTGLTPAEAEAELAQAGLVFGGSSNEFSDAITAGHVIHSDPAAGVEVVPGSVVVLLVSDGPVMVQVPNLTGLTSAAAGGELVLAGLEVGGSTLAFSDNEAVGQVIESNPAAGTEVVPGTVVALVISDGPAPPDTVQVPDLTGLTPATAETMLNLAGLEVGESTRAFNLSVNKDLVSSSNPTAGADVAPGSEVGLVISDGPWVFEVLEIAPVVMPFVLLSPDLSVSGLSLNPSVPVQGQQVRVDVSVRNGGGASASDFVVEWWAGENFPEAACTWSVSGLDAGAEWTQSCIYDGYTSWYGQLTTVVLVDATGTVAEQDETNNEFKRIISVSKP